MSPLGTPDYRVLADHAVEIYKDFSSKHPGARSKSKSDEPRSSRDFDQELTTEVDQYIAGSFVEDSWIGKLESDVQGEEGLYNVAVDPSLRTPFALIMPTRDYHPQSAPLRTSYLVHTYRLLVALEDRLRTLGEGGGGKAMAVYDCGEKSGVVLGHKCIRFFVASNLTVPTIPYQSYPLNIGPGAETREGEVFSSLLQDPSSNTQPRIPKHPHYNLVMTRQELIIVPRSDDGFLDGEQGRWDGARLCGVDL